MNRTRFVFVLIIIVALLIIGISQKTETPTSPDPVPVSGTPPPAGSIVVEIHSSNTKQDWMDQVVASFNAAGHTVNGKPIAVTVAHVGSGSSMNNILEGKIQPVVWSPGSDLWVTSINQAWQDRTGGRLINTDCSATLRLPLAIAIWQPMAEAMGWPDAPIGWDDLASLSTNPDGWAAYGHPEWGQFKFGHPHPEHSNSGMLSLVAEVYSAAGMTGGLTIDVVKSQAVGEDASADTDGALAPVAPIAPGSTPAETASSVSTNDARANKQARVID